MAYRWALIRGRAFIRAWAVTDIEGAIVSVCINEVSGLTLYIFKHLPKRYLIHPQQPC